MPLETMQEAIRRLEADGYGGEFRADNGALRCPACGHRHDPAQVSVDETVRFEGASDPDDEAVLFALSCASCGARGTYAVAYGPAMPAEDVEVVRRLP